MVKYKTILSVPRKGLTTSWLASLSPGALPLAQLPLRRVLIPVGLQVLAFPSASTSLACYDYHQATLRSSWSGLERVWRRSER